MLGLGSGSSPTTEWTFHNQGSLSFDGTDDYIQIDNIADELAAKFDNGEGANEVNFTISMWAKLGTMSTTGVAFNLRVGTGANNHINLQWHGSNNQLRFTCKFNGTSEVAIDTGGSASGAAENWVTHDNQRGPYNVIAARLELNTNDDEATNINAVDFLSNGFKLRTDDSMWNGDGNTYIFAAFAETPFKTALAR